MKRYHRIKSASGQEQDNLISRIRQFAENKIDFHGIFN